MNTYIPTQEHIDMWNRGWSAQNIADHISVHRMTVSRGFSRIGLGTARRKNPMIVKAIEEARRLRDSGMRMYDIADRIGYSRRHIQRCLNN